MALIGLFVLRAKAMEPQEPARPSNQRSPFEAVTEPPQSAPPKAWGPPIAAIEFRGAGSLPQSMLRVLIASRVGGAYDQETLRRDAQALYRTGRFSDIVWETEQSRSGPIVRFVVVERPLIQSIEYHGDDTVTIPEILARFEQRKIKLRSDTLYDEAELGRAAVTVQELVAERGRRNIKVTPLVEPSRTPSIVKIIFRAEEKQ